MLTYKYKLKNKYLQDVMSNNYFKFNIVFYVFISYQMLLNYVYIF